MKNKVESRSKLIINIIKNKIESELYRGLSKILFEYKWYMTKIIYILFILEENL